MGVMISVLIFLLMGTTQQRMVTGVVAIDNNPISGAKVSVIETGIMQETDGKGRFQLDISNDLKEFTLLIHYPGPDACKTKIERVLMDSQQLHLDTIPLSFNEMVSVAEYEKMKSAKRKNYKIVYHYNRLIGYIHTSRIDTIELKAKLDKRNLKFRYDSSENTIVIDYKDLVR